MLLVLDQVLAAGGGKQRRVVSHKASRQIWKQCKLSGFCDGNICAYLCLSKSPFEDKADERVEHSRAMKCQSVGAQLHPGRFREIHSCSSRIL